jgi:peptidoglycan hydrolase-like protein with peptidoglycan-binding domain
MADKWHDINNPGAWRKPEKPESGSGKPADPDDAPPEPQKPLVKLSEGKFVPPAEGTAINKKCPVQVNVEYLDDSAKSMQKVTFSLYANYKDATSNLSHYVDGFEKDGVAQAEMTMYPPPGYQEGDSVDYFFKVEHIRGEKVIDSEDLTLSMETQSIILQRGDYDENGAAAYNKDQSGDNFKPNNVVKKLQGDLITTNFLPKGSDDGFFGDQTDKAVKDFQDYAIKLVRMKRSEGKTENTDKGLDQQSPDGIVGEKTRDELDKWLNNNWVKPVPTLRHGEYDDTGVDNGKGKKGTDDHHQGTPVVEAQNNLKKVGVYTDGAVDGWFYDKMLDAVKQFQDAAVKGKFLINEVLTDIGDILSGHQKGEVDAKTQEFMKKVVDKGGVVPKEFDIDWEFIAKLEGTKNEMYVPCDNKGNVLGVSGPTIASGFDLGQIDEAGLKEYKFSSPLEAKLLPYVSLTGDTAKDFVKKTPLTLLDLEINEINKKVKTKYAKKAEKFFNEAAKKDEPFITQSKAYQTVFASVYFQYGTGQQLRGNLVDGDNVAAIKTLLNFTTKTFDIVNKKTKETKAVMQYLPRRCQEARYLLNSLTDDKEITETKKIIEEKEKEWNDANG